MRVRTRIALLAAVALSATSFGQQPRLLPPPPAPHAPRPTSAADGPQIACEVRIVSVRDDFFERVGLDFDPKTGVLTDAQLQTLLEAAQGDPSTNVMCAPKVTVDDGQKAQVNICEMQLVARGGRVALVDGKATFQPELVAVEVGQKLTLHGTVSADRKQVRVEVKHVETALEDRPAKLAVSNWVTPKFEGGATGKPVPVTETVEMPKVATRTIDKTVTVPDGGHVVIPGQCREMTTKVREKVAVMADLPYLGELFTQTREETQKIRTLLVVSPKVIPAQVAPAAPAVPPTVYQLRNAAAQDVACTLREYLATKNWNVRVNFDAPSNSVFISGEPSQQQEVIKLLAKLDEPASTAVYRLRNVAAADAVQAVTAHAARHNLGVRVVADAATNSVVVSGNPSQQQEVIKLLAKLDAAPPQVLVKMTVVKVKAGFAEEIGLTDGKAGEAAWVVTPRELRMVNAAFRASKERNEIDVLSRPQIVVQDNQTGHVQIGQQFPVPAHGAGDQGQKIEYADVGMTTRVTPRIGADGKTVLLRVETQLTEVAPMPVKLGNGLSAPAFNTQSLQTTAIAPVGGTLVVRGAMQKDAKGCKTEVLILMTVEKVSPQQ